MLRWLRVAFVMLLAQAPLPQQPPTFRAGTVLVPVDVRVLDRTGNPVRDLARADFRIIEDGIPQTITQFSATDFTAGASSEAVAAATVTAGAEAPHRTFLVILGRGRLQGPSKGFDAVETFIRKRLLPGDQVGLVAYDRVTDLTTDHASILRLLRIYRDRHERIEALLDQWFSGLTAFFARRDAPPGIQKRIDEIFTDRSTAAARHLVSLAAPGEGDFERDRRRMLDVLEPGHDDTNSVYMAALHDAEKLSASIEYLRGVDGEKHIVLLSEEGLIGAGADGMNRIAAMAADARVTISPIHTGGIPTSWATAGAGMSFEGPSWAHRAANAASREMAERTGGTAAIFEYAHRPLDRLDRSTRFTYVLGYYPTRPVGDGSRRLEVKVARPDVEVVHRGAYYANPASKAYDRRDFLSGSRLWAASAYRLPVTDVKVTLSTAIVPGEPRQTRVKADIRIDPATVRFEQVDGHHVAAVDIALFLGAGREEPLGDRRQRMDMRLSDVAFAKLAQEGLAVTMTIDVPERPRHVKVVVYDYLADKVGTALQDIR